MKRLALLLLVFALVAPGSAFAQEPAEPTPAAEEEEFDPSHEWELQTWGPELKIGPIDMSVNKAVAYLILGMLVSIAIGILFMRVKVGRDPGPQAGARGDDLRHRAGAGGGAGPADEGDRALVPVRRDPDDLHLGREHPRLHPAAALGRALRDRRSRAADARDLRRHLDALGHARPRADDLLLHPLSRAFAGTARSSTSRAGSRTCRRRCCR